MNDLLQIGGRFFNSRLLIGSGKYSSNELIPEIVRSSDSEILTVAIRRIDIDAKTENILSYIPKEITLMPNTSGARNASEAVRIARIAKAMGCGNFIKIEVINDNKYLLPDNSETIKATEILVREGFIVLPYISPDIYTARRLCEVGAAAVMPLGAPIGTNRGLKTKELLQILINEISIPVIVDAGIGKPSEAAEAMEIGADAVLVNTAIATADNPVLMAKAFSLAVQAGRKAYLAGLGKTFVEAVSTSPMTGFLRKEI